MNMTNQQSKSRYAVVLLNLGGPDSLDAIEPFLFNLFSDKDIFKIPIGQSFFAKTISKRRAPKVSEEYKLIGGNSPINEWTETQRKLLEERLRSESNNLDAFTAMRYWHPLTEEVTAQIESGNYEKVILLPLYPHYSISTTGSSFNEWKRHYKGDAAKLIYVNAYYEHPDYIRAINGRIDESLGFFPEDIRNQVQLVFSAHGTPVSMVKKGDPYSKQVQRTVELVMETRNNSHPYHLCYQSKVGPVKWLEPSTDQMIEKLAREGKRDLLIVPISFVSDHVETLYELDIEYRHVADQNNIRNYFVMKGLNDSAEFISALAKITSKYLRNSH